MGGDGAGPRPRPTSPPASTTRLRRKRHELLHNRSNERAVPPLGARPSHGPWWPVRAVKCQAASYSMKRARSVSSAASLVQPPSCRTLREGAPSSACRLHTFPHAVVALPLSCAAPNGRPPSQGLVADPGDSWRFLGQAPWLQTLVSPAFFKPPLRRLSSSPVRIFSPRAVPHQAIKLFPDMRQMPHQLIRTACPASAANTASKDSCCALITGHGRGDGDGEGHFCCW
jgi:hypothetical protein